MNRAEQIDAFCSALLGGPFGTGDDRLDGWSTYVWTLDQAQPKPAKMTTWSPAQPGSLASILHTEVRRQPDQIGAVYVSLGMAPTAAVEANNTRHGEVVPAHRRRLTADDVQGIPTLWADIDIAGPGHKATHYPPDQASAMQIVDAIGLPPSMILHSGGGLQPYWLLVEPWLATDATDPVAEKTAMAALSRDLVHTLGHHARRLGTWAVDAVFNLDRVMRAPGSLNCKGVAPRPVKMVHFDPGARYEPDQIREHLAPDDVLAEFAQRSITGRAGEVAASLPDVNLVAAWQAARAAPAHLPTWLADLLELSPGSILEATWANDRPDLDDDPNRLDAALVRLLLNVGVSAQRQAEAVMARRLSTGQKPDKVDPMVRTDYLVRTIANVHGAAAAAGVDTVASQHRRDTLADTVARAAAARVAIPAPVTNSDDTPTVAPPTARATSTSHGAASVAVELEPELPSDPLADFTTELLAAEPAPEPQPDPVPIRVHVAAQRREQEEQPPPADPWGERHDDAVATLQELDVLLTPPPYRERGVQVWRLEERDRGPAATGRLVLRLPVDFDWPGGNRPKLYRPGLPFYLDWWRRDDFETPKAFRRSMERDAKIPAQPVGSSKDDWIMLISALVPFWAPDSSGTDMTTQMHEWLLEYLISRPATTEETEAVTAGRPFLSDHAQWGVGGAPTILVQQSGFLAFVATQPGGRSGRDAIALLDHLHVHRSRPRLRGEGGQSRKRLFEIASSQFTPLEWREILQAAKDAADGRERRGMRMIKGGA
jgi:hypothetical protein